MVAKKINYTYWSFIIYNVAATHVAVLWAGSGNGVDGKRGPGERVVYGRGNEEVNELMIRERVQKSIAVPKKLKGTVNLTHSQEKNQQPQAKLF